MELMEIRKLQDEFDKEHAGNFEWSARITPNNLEVLEFLLLSLVGEVGELSNITKKIIRGDFELASAKEHVEDEVADIFIYLIKICNQMEIDLEKIFLNKLEKNKVRFSNFKKKQ